MTLRTKYLLLSLLAVAVMAVFCVFNLGQGEDNIKTLYFSREPGFYDAPFDLEIVSLVDGEVFYTTDGSTPTRDSTPYTDPIRLSDPSDTPVRYAANTDVSTGFREDLLAQIRERVPDYGYGMPGYQVPEQVDKCNVLRAAVYDGDVCVATATGTFFVGMQQKPLYDRYCLVSVVTDPDNLFDHDDGIYVAGGDFEYYQKERALENSPWYFWHGNYSQRGRDNERPAHIEIFGEDQSLELSSPCGIRIHGKLSRSLLPKSLNVYARKEYGGSDTFPSLFDREPHKIMLFAGGNDNVYMLLDGLVQSLSADLKISTMAMRPCMVFLDGEFWGSSYVTEAYDSKYIQDHYTIAENSVILVKAGELAEGDEGDLAIYQQMVDFITNQDMTVEENYQQAQKLIDMESYIDYFAVQLFIARSQDWPIGNVSQWRSRDTSLDNEYWDGRWRWMLYDSNSPGIAVGNITLDTLELALDEDSMFASLCENADFKAKLSQRMYDMGKQVFTEEKVSQYLAYYLETMAPAIEANALRFYNEDVSQGIVYNARDIQTFFTERTAFLDTMIKNNFGEGYVQCSTAMN